MKLYQRIQWLLLTLAMPLTTVLANTPYNNFVFETENITVASRVYYGLEATFYTGPWLNEYKSERENLGTIHYHSDDCIYSYFKKWPDVVRKKDKCSNLPTWQDGKQNFSDIPQRNYTELFSPSSQGLNLFAGALIVELSPVREGHILHHKYTPEGEVTSDVPNGDEGLMVTSCVPKVSAAPGNTHCEKGSWRDHGYITWPGNVKERKLSVNVDSLSDGGVILTFYNFQEPRHGLNIYTYDYRNKKYKNLRIEVVNKLITPLNVSSSSITVNNTQVYNNTSAKSNHAATFGSVSHFLKILFSMMGALNYRIF